MPVVSVFSLVNSCSPSLTCHVSPAQWDTAHSPSCSSHCRTSPSTDTAAVWLQLLDSVQLFVQQVFFLFVCLFVCFCFFFFFLLLYFYILILKDEIVSHDSDWSEEEGARSVNRGLVTCIRGDYWLKTGGLHLSWRRTDMGKWHLSMVGRITCASWTEFRGCQSVCRTLHHLLRWCSQLRVSLVLLLSPGQTCW